MTDQCRAGQGTDHACPREARAAIKTTNGVRLATVIYYDDLSAPKGAIRYCKEHAVATVFSLATDLIVKDG